MTIHDIMKISGYSKEQISARFGIPIVTLKSWIYGYRKPPEWVLTMFSYIIMLERSLDQYEQISKEGLGAGIPGTCEGSSKTSEEIQSENVKT